MQNSAWFKNSMHLKNRFLEIYHMFKKVLRQDLFRRIGIKWPREVRQVALNIWLPYRINVDVSFVFFITAPEIYFYNSSLNIL